MTPADDGECSGLDGMGEMMTNESLVSIIVPIYDVEAYLHACIESLQNQTYPHLQIILVDDQSPDRCPEICDDYAQRDKRILVVHQKNKGVSGARNTGLRHADGDYIMFVDSDDALYPNAVETLLRDAEDCCADIVAAAAATVNEAGEIVHSGEDGTYTVYRDDAPLRLSLAGNHHTLSAWAKLFKASFIQGIRFEEGRSINEDGFFVFQCFMRKPVLVVHDVPVYLYSIRQNSGSRQVFSEKYLSMLYFCDRKKELVTAAYPQLTDEIRNMEARTNLELLQVLCGTTDRRYRRLQRSCIHKFRALRSYHRPANAHHKRLAWIVLHRLYPAYKLAVRMKYYR